MIASEASEVKRFFRAGQCYQCYRFGGLLLRAKSLILQQCSLCYDQNRVCGENEVVRPVTTNLKSIYEMTKKRFWGCRLSLPRNFRNIGNITLFYWVYIYIFSNNINNKTNITPLVRACLHLQRKITARHQMLPDVIDLPHLLRYTKKKKSNWKSGQPPALGRPLTWIDCDDQRSDACLACGPHAHRTCLPLQPCRHGPCQAAQGARTC